MIGLPSVLALSAIIIMITLCLLPSRRKRDRGDIHKALAAAVERHKTAQEQERELQQEIASRLAAAGISTVKIGPSAVKVFTQWRIYIPDGCDLQDGAHYMETLPVEPGDTVKISGPGLKVAEGVSYVIEPGA